MSLWTHASSLSYVRVGRPVRLKLDEVRALTCRCSKEMEDHGAAVDPDQKAGSKSLLEVVAKLPASGREHASSRSRRRLDLRS